RDVGFLVVVLAEDLDGGQDGEGEVVDREQACALGDGGVQVGERLGDLRFLHPAGQGAEGGLGVRGDLGERGVGIGKEVEDAVLEVGGGSEDGWVGGHGKRGKGA